MNSERMFFPEFFFDGVEVIDTVECPRCGVSKVEGDSCCPIALLPVATLPDSHLGAVCD